MKCLSVVLSLAMTGFIFSVGCLAQDPAPAPAPAPAPQPQPATVRESNTRLQQIDNQRRVNDAFNQLEALSNDRGRTDINLPSPLELEKLNAMYRKTSKEERQFLAPSKIDLDQFGDFLRQPDTGLIKLMTNKGCAENPNIVVATPECLARAMPGAGSSYSFRTKDYRIPRLADITYADNNFESTGARLHGIFTEIGDVPLEQISVSSKGLNYLVNFKPESDFQKARELSGQLCKGIENDGFLYRCSINAKENTTYLLRSVAYRGTYYRAVGNITYNELDLDKRKDVIVAFRIVRRYADGTLTILWKMLSKQDSPKTTWTKDDKDGKSKTSDFRVKGK